MSNLIPTAASIDDFFNFSPGDYALFRWSDRGPGIIRVWSPATYDQDLALFELMGKVGRNPEHPLYDAICRLRAEL